MHSFPVRTSLILLALAAPANADRFHLDTAEERAKYDSDGNGGDRVIDGVIVSEDEDNYNLRVVGGELVLAKSAVVEIERNSLDVAAIERMEQEQADALAAAESSRQELRAVEASARREAILNRRIEPIPEESLLIEVDFQGLLPGYTFRTYDPVIRRANLTGLRQVIEDFLRAEVMDAAHRK